MGSSLDAIDGAIVNVTGGSLGGYVDVSESKLVVNGGSVGDEVGLFDGSTLDMISGQLGNGLHLSNSTANISGGMTGGGILITESELNVTGGIVNGNVNAAFSSSVNIAGGAVGNLLLVQTASILNLQSGSLGANAEMRGAEVVANISGGTVGDGFRVEFGAKVNVSGGSIGGNFNLNRGTVNISGGSFAGSYNAAEYTTTNVHGSKFILNGVDVTSTLKVGVKHLVSNRNVTLQGLLSDGSAFSFDLNTNYITGADRFHNYANLYLHLTPEPGDFNADGIMDGADFLVWQRGGSPAPGSSADLNLWQSNFGTAITASSLSVPEPAAALLQATATLVGVGGGVRRQLGCRRRNTVRLSKPSR